MAGAIAIAAGAALPLAPVEQSDVRVTWPADGETVESTALLLTNQTPHSLDVTFTGEAALSVGDDGGVLFSTIRPDAADVSQNGLIASVSGGTLTIETAGQEWSWPIGATQTWQITSTIDGLEIVRDGRAVETADDIPPPQIDTLITDTAGLGADDLSARLQLVDDANNRPTPLKITLIAVCILALALMLVLLGRDDGRLSSVRHVEGVSGGAWNRTRLNKAMRFFGPADFVLVGLLTLWIFIGPMTDDDGYYAVMALNAKEAGYVGNYFQLFNQTFTPFTWLWQFFDIWQQWGGRSPVWLRLPSLVFAVVAWFLSKAILNRFVTDMRWVAAEGTRLLLAVVTFVWWASYSIGSRPEPFVAMATVVVVTLLVRSHRTRRLVPGAFAVGVAALSFAAHPIGVVAAAPLVLSVPMLWGIAREQDTVRAALARTIAVTSTSAVALLAAFSDGTLSDMLTGSRRFALVEAPLAWVDEFRRYGLLFADIAMGSYAKRSVVLVGLVLLLWFVVFVLWSRRVAPFSSPVPLSLVGWAFGLSFVLMWITTSKWTHHFGSLASIGPLLIVLVSVVVPRLIRAQLGAAAKLPPWLAPVAVLSLVPAMIVSLRGPDAWAYEWGEQLSRPASPELFGVSLANYYAWAGLAVVTIVAAFLLAKRRDSSSLGPSALVGVTSVVAVFFLMTGTYLAASFARTASGLQPGFTLGKAYLADPAGGQCLPDRAIRLWDAASGTALPAETGDATLDGFVSLRGSSAQAPPSSTSGLTGWTSTGQDTAGALLTPWYRVPSLSAGQRIGVLVSGDFASGTVGEWAVEIRGDDGRIRSIAPADPTSRVGWSTVLIDIPEDVAGGDSQVRLSVTDLSAVPGSDVSVTAPVLIEETTLHAQTSPDAPTAVGWMQTFWFPCDRPMTVARGVIEPPRFATTFGPNGIENIWVLSRGGSLAGVQRLATVNTPATGLGASADPSWGRVHFFEYPTEERAYDLVQAWRWTPGWRSAFAPASQLVSG